MEDADWLRSQETSDAGNPEESTLQETADEEGGTQITSSHSLVRPDLVLQPFSNPDDHQSIRIETTC